MAADTGLFDDGAIVIGHAIIFVIADLKLFKNLNFHQSVLDLYKFDDERVTKEDAKRAIEEQYGGEEEVARDKDLTEQIGRDIYFDLVDHDKVRSFRIQKQLPFSIFKAFKSSRRSTICPKSGNFSVVVLIWSMVGQLREISNKAQNAELKLLLEVELGPVELSHPDAELRLLEVFYHKIYKVSYCL
ncbi:hypothetical protein BHE74_00000910 [Ensete ventricosum]|nr:hypothetical protein BHE74_00000910 [Ensete ventricosum]